MNIENIHKMRKSLDLVMEAIAVGDATSHANASFECLLASSGWGYHCRYIIEYIT
jgi:hypothetical protein